MISNRFLRLVFINKPTKDSVINIYEYTYLMPCLISNSISSKFKQILYSFSYFFTFKNYQKNKENWLKDFKNIGFVYFYGCCFIFKQHKLTPTKFIVYFFGKVFLFNEEESYWHNDIFYLAERTILVKTRLLLISLFFR